MSVQQLFESEARGNGDNHHHGSESRADEDDCQKHACNDRPSVLRTWRIFLALDDADGTVDNNGVQDSGNDVAVLTRHPYLGLIKPSQTEHSSKTIVELEVRVSVVRG